MKKLLIATTNPGKLAEFQEFLSDMPLELVTLNDVGITVNVEESGETFEENARIKAARYAAISGLPTLADDGGFEIEALGGEPGVHSHRWIHHDREDEDEELIQHVLFRLQGVPVEKRGAQLHLVLVFALPSGESWTSEALVKGNIPFEASSYRRVGFPYRSLLYLPEIQKFYNHEELTAEENKTYNHRRHAVEELKAVIQHTLC